MYFTDQSNQTNFTFRFFFDKNNHQTPRIIFQVILLSQKTCSLVYIIFNACFQYAFGKPAD